MCWSREKALIKLFRRRACGLRYQKPLSGTVASANPGCPACGYLGWTLDSEAEAPTAPRIEKRA